MFLPGRLGAGRPDLDGHPGSADVGAGGPVGPETGTAAAGRSDGHRRGHQDPAEPGTLLQRPPEHLARRRLRLQGPAAHLRPLPRLRNAQHEG